MEFRDRAAVLTGLYEGEVAGTDRAIGRLLDGVARRGLAGRTVVAATADHGENLVDHAPFFDHRNYLYDSLVRVPLVVRIPGGGGGIRDEEPVDVMSLVPTLLDLLGEKAPASMQGRSFAGRVRGEGRDADREIFLDSGLQERPHKGIRTDRWKVTLDLTEDRYVWFDLTADPGEVAPLSEPPMRAAPLRASLDEWIRRVRRARPAPESPLSPGEIDRLRELGYF
jgi:arylsulfatase A-like enzyme